MKEKGKSDDQKGKGKANGKGKKGNETRVCHECNKPGYLRKGCTVYKKRMAEKRGHRENGHDSGSARSNGRNVESTLKMTMLTRLVKP